MPEGDTVIEADDEVFFIAAANDIQAVMSEMRRTERPNKRLIIAGGGHIGQGLARSLEHRYGVRVIERIEATLYELSEALRSSHCISWRCFRSRTLVRGKYRRNRRILRGY